MYIFIYICTYIVTRILQHTLQHTLLYIYIFIYIYRCQISQMREVCKGLAALFMRFEIAGYFGKRARLSRTLCQITPDRFDRGQNATTFSTRSFTMYCSVLQCVAVCCSGYQRVAVCCCVLPRTFRRVALVYIEKLHVELTTQADFFTHQVNQNLRKSDSSFHEG